MRAPIMCCQQHGDKLQRVVPRGMHQCQASEIFCIRAWAQASQQLDIPFSAIVMVISVEERKKIEQHPRNIAPTYTSRTALPEAPSAFLRSDSFSTGRLCRVLDLGLFDANESKIMFEVGGRSKRDN